MMFTPISSTALALGIILLLSYCLFGAIYRLFFHPLAKFPGPKLAAVTGWYEFYHDIVRRGMFIWHIQKLHDHYGPIVRVTPDELHVRDPEYFDEIYSLTKKRDKWSKYVILAGAPDSTGFTIDHDLHRKRRSSLNHFFSKKAILERETQIAGHVEHLCRRFKECMENGEIVRLDAAFTALTMDIITDFSFGSSSNYIADPDFNLAWKETLIAGSGNGAFLRMFPWSFPIMKATPLSFLEYGNPPAARLVSWQRMVRKQVDSIIANNQIGKKAEGTIFQALLDSDMPKYEKTAQRLQDEGQVVVGAGSETTAKALAMATFFLSSDDLKLKRLRDEIARDGYGPNGLLELARLEKLPYLTACITEAVRMMAGITSRSPRVPHEDMKYHNYTIPAGTAISQMTYVVNYNPEIFPKPLEYHPERWTEAAEKGVRLDRYMTSFSKGTRNCVGINLAWAEMYLALANIATRFDMEIHDTTAERDILIDRDFFVGVPKPESKGVRAKIVRAL